MQGQKHKLIQMEKFSTPKNKVTSIYRSILQQNLSFYHLNSLKRSAENNENINFSQNTRIYFIRFLEMSQNFQYEATFTNNILLLGQKGCGKTSFVLSLGKNKIFGCNLLSVDWVSKINVTKNREDEMRQCFIYTNVDFHYPNDVEELNLLIETFQKETYGEDEKAYSDSKIDGDGCNIFGENKKFHQLIVMDDVLRSSRQVK